MRVEATIRQQTVIVLINSRSTHNFINEKVASWLRLPVTPIKPFFVKITYGSPMRCQGRFGGVLMHIQGISFLLTLFSLPLTGLDVVLGVQWLESLNPVACNWKDLTTAFHWNNQSRLLCGLGAPPIQPAMTKRMDKEATDKHSLYVVCLLPRMEENVATVNQKYNCCWKSFQSFSKSQISCDQPEK